MPKFALLFLLVSTMLGLRAWGDDLVVVLFEFLDDDTKLAQSCTDWLYVKHWYTVVPDPTMRVTLWALMTSKPSSMRLQHVPLAALRPGSLPQLPCNARDALGAHGSRRELSRVHSRHIAPLFFLFQILMLRPRK